MYQFMDGFYHAKVLVVDDHFCDIGTANFDKRSFFINFEINNLIFDKGFIQTLKKEMEKDMEASDHIKRKRPRFGLHAHPRKRTHRFSHFNLTLGG